VRPHRSHPTPSRSASNRCGSGGSTRKLRSAIWGQSKSGGGGTAGSDAGHLATLIPSYERRAPIVTVHDSASHALASLGSAFGASVVPLGVDDFGQSGARPDLHGYYGIDPESIVSAALLALDLQGG
jgi:hypothetical protein